MGNTKLLRAYQTNVPVSRDEKFIVSKLLLLVDSLEVNNDIIKLLSPTIRGTFLTLVEEIAYIYDGAREVPSKLVNIIHHFNTPLDPYERTVKQVTHF
jgi:hypothetical protein